MCNPVRTWLIIVLVTCALGSTAVQATDFATLRRNVQVVKKEKGNHRAKTSERMSTHGRVRRITFPAQILTEPGSIPVGTYSTPFRSSNGPTKRISVPDQKWVFVEKKAVSKETLDSGKGKREVCSAINKYRKEMIEYAKAGDGNRKPGDLGKAVSNLTKVLARYGQDKEVEKLVGTTLDVVAKIHGGLSAAGTKSGDKVLKELQALLKPCN